MFADYVYFTIYIITLKEVAFLNTAICLLVDILLPIIVEIWKNTCVLGKLSVLIVNINTYFSFFIDFPDIQAQEMKLHCYLQNHFGNEDQVSFSF